MAYVFLHLFREIADGKDVVGPHIFLIVLCGFLLYYCVEDLVETRLLKEPADENSPIAQMHFRLVILFKWIYSWLVIYALPEAVRHEGAHVIPAILAVGLHILHDDVELAERYEKHYAHEGRYILALAPLVGWVCDLYFFETDEMGFERADRHPRRFRPLHDLRRGIGQPSEIASPQFSGPASSCSLPSTSLPSDLADQIRKGRIRWPDYEPADSPCQAS